MEKQLENIANSLEDFNGELETMRYYFKSDLTQWNVVEAIENLSFELKRMNDREESK
jgi:hypothetical protein